MLEIEVDDLVRPTGYAVLRKPVVEEEKKKKKKKEKEKENLNGQED